MNNGTARPRRILPVIIISQFLGTSLWFATNAVLPDLQRHLTLSGDVVGLTTSAVQFGFITGTLCFSFFAIPDRFSPRNLFAVCSLAGALCNLSVLFLAKGLATLILLRFLTGAALAGIYPVGMKIAAGWYREGLGNALGLLVGALVLGTSFPHLLKSIGGAAEWQTVILCVSAAAGAGGILMFSLVSDGPYHTPNTAIDLGAPRVIFRSRKLRLAAFGYFGHMWELYTFYALLPFALAAHRSLGLPAGTGTSFWAFAVIGAGSIGCSAGGMISRHVGSAKVAWAQLFLSGLCCLLSPLFFVLPRGTFLALFILWGTVVVGDSPQFSAMVARYAPSHLIGSALTIVNCIGFAITIVSIELTSRLSQFVRPEYIFSLLTIGPLVGLVSSWPLIRNSGNGSHDNRAETKS